MSKAFVKEDDGADFEDLRENAPEGGPEDGTDDFDDQADDGDADKSPAIRGARGKNYITVKGLDRLKNELHELLSVERPKVVETVAWAASNGDRSENADYQYGKKRLREIDRRVRFLQKRIDIAVVVDPSLQKGNRVLFGATVTVEDENGETRTYRIVGMDETDAKSGKISWISPIGQALLQAREGDAVVVKTPRGEDELEIVKIEFVDFD